MKIRSGFVSNSSSSSFILNHPMTTAEVATIMLYEVKKDWMSYPDPSIPDNFQDAISWLKDNQNYDEPILFPWSCNYETFIWRNTRGICVDTCNNHSWTVLAPNYDGEHYFREEDDEYPIDEWDEKFYVNARGKFLNLSDMSMVTREEFMEAQRRKWSKIT